MIQMGVRNVELLQPTTRVSTADLLDLTDPTTVDIAVSADGRHVHVNVDGICLLRVNGSRHTACEIAGLRRVVTHIGDEL